MKFRTERLIAVTLITGIAGLMGCNPETSKIQWLVEFATDELRERAAVVEVSLLEGGCDGSATNYVHETTETQTLPQPPLLVAGRYGLRARGRDARCLWYATGCADVSLPENGPIVRVTLIATPEVVLCPPEDCISGFCENGPDADSDTDADVIGDVDADTGPDTDIDTDTTTDTTAPTIVPPTIPADGATAVPPCTNLVVTFDEPVVLISGGSVTLRNLTFGSGSDVVIPLPDDQVSVSGADLTINPRANLDFNTDYAVQISANAVEDLNGNHFAGIISDDDWNFSTPAWPSGIEVTPNHIMSGSVIGTLLAIDVPYVPTIPATGGPDWPGTADDGFTTVNSPIREDDGTSGWEPDGTPLSEAKCYRVYDGGDPSVKYIFDLPDGTLINAVYATWNTRLVDGCTYSYTEGLYSDSVTINQHLAPIDDLVLSWTDDVRTVREANFQLLFARPITVVGGNGFELWAWDNYGNAAHIDAIVLDISS